MQISIHNDLLATRNPEQIKRQKQSIARFVCQEVIECPKSPWEGQHNERAAFKQILHSLCDHNKM